MKKGKEISVQEALNMKDGTHIIYVCEKLPEERVLTTKFGSRVAIDLNGQYYMRIAQDAQDKCEYKLYTLN